MGKLIEVQEKMDAKQYCEILEDGLVENFETLEMERGSTTFNRTMIQNTPLTNGLKIIIFKSYFGSTLHSLT
jgi:hypothetical protein